MRCVWSQACWGWVERIWMMSIRRNSSFYHKYSIRVCCIHRCTIWSPNGRRQMSVASSYRLCWAAHLVLWQRGHWPVCLWKPSVGRTHFMCQQLSHCLSHWFGRYWYTIHQRSILASPSRKRITLRKLWAVQFPKRRSVARFMYIQRKLLWKLKCFCLQGMPPFTSLAVSAPFLALIVLHYGNMWGLNFLITAAPKFMNEVLGFNLAHAGILASLPYLARMFAGLIFGAMGDSIRRANLLTVTGIRKSFCLFCKHCLPSLVIFIV